MLFKNNSTILLSPPRCCKNSKIPKIGMRTIKTALAVLLTELIINLIIKKLLGSLFIDWFNQDISLYISGSISVLAATLTMQDTKAKSFESAVDRLIATVIGVVTSVVLLLIIQYFRNVSELAWNISFYLSVAFGGVIVIYTTLLINRRSVSALSMVILASILFYYTRPVPYLAVFQRAIETVVGIGVSLIINIYFFPHKNKYLFLSYNNCIKTKIVGVQQKMNFEKHGTNFIGIKNDKQKLNKL